MSPVAARDLLTLPAVLAFAFVALVALAGASVGAWAAVLALPAGAIIGLSQLRTAEREDALRLLSQQDALTGLGNRRLLQQRLSYEIARHGRHERRFTVLALDLDGFKGVNDRFGHQAGDEVLCDIARALDLDPGLLSDTPATPALPNPRGLVSGGLKTVVVMAPL